MIVTDNLPDQINGVVTTFKNLAKEAASDGFDLVYLDPRQFPHCGALGYPEVKISWPRQIGPKIQALDPDYVHIATEGPIGLATRLWLDRHGYSYNTSYHTRFPEFLKKLYGVPESWSWRYLRWFHKHSGRVLTTTTSMVQELQQHGFNGDIRAWTRGVDTTVLRPTMSRTERSPHDRVRVLYVGRVSVEKNLDALCELEDRYDIAIVGNGPYLPTLKKRYPGVNFVGYRTGAELANWYVWADVFCFPSRLDTFGIVMIESMSQGTPVAAYPVSGPLDVVMPGITGYLDNTLSESIDRCIGLDRSRVQQQGLEWTWQRCWHIFRDNLVPISPN